MFCSGRIVTASPMVTLFSYSCINYAHWHKFCRKFAKEVGKVTSSNRIKHSVKRADRMDRAEQVDVITTVLINTHLFYKKLL